MFSRYLWYDCVRSPLGFQERINVDPQHLPGMILRHPERLSSMKKTRTLSHLTASFTNQQWVNLWVQIVSSTYIKSGKRRNNNYCFGCFSNKAIYDIEVKQELHSFAQICILLVHELPFDESCWTRCLGPFTKFGVNVSGSTSINLGYHQKHHHRYTTDFQLDFQNVSKKSFSWRASLSK